MNASGWWLGLLLPTILLAAPAGELRRGNGPEPATLNPHVAQDVAAHNVLRDVFEGLLSESATGTLEPGQAESYSISEDGLAVRFLLRDGLKFSDGSPLTAADFAESLKLALAPASAAPYAQMLSMIKTVSAPDQRTLLLTLNRRAPELFAALTLPIAYPLHKSLRGAPNSAFSRPERLIGNGAYRLQEWRSQSFISLRRNPYFRAQERAPIERAPIEQVRFVLTDDPAAEYKRFRAGDLDITDTVPSGPIDRLRERHGAALRVSPYLGTVYFGYNLSRPPFKDNPALRRALSLALDREILTRYISGAGEQATHALVPALLLTPPEESLRRAALSESARVQEARAALAASGYQSATDPPIEIRFNANPSQRRLALAIQAMWLQTLGVRSSVRQEEWKVFLVNRKQRRVTEVFRMSWVADLATPENFLNLFESRSALNYTGLQDPIFDAAMATARSSDDPGARQNAFAQAHARLIDADVILPLYHYVSRHLVDPRVCGFVAHPLDRRLSRHLWLCQNKAP